MKDINKTDYQAFRTPEGDTWARLEGRHFQIKDKDGAIMLQPRHSRADLVAISYESLSRLEQITFEGLLALMADPDTVWLFGSDDELFYQAPHGATFLVKQGLTVTLRERPIPAGALFTFSSDAAVVAMTDIADDLEDERRTAREGL